MNSFRLGIDVPPNWFNKLVERTLATVYNIENPEKGERKTYCLIKTNEKVEQVEEGDLLIKENDSITVVTKSKK